MRAPRSAVFAAIVAGSLAAQADAVPRYVQRSIATLSPVKVAYISAPALADLDSDSDIDVILGSGDGRLRYFRRDRWGLAERVGSSNPFDGFVFGGIASPAAVDVDGDGDDDVAVGVGDGTIAYLENTGSAVAPEFEQQLATDNPFDGIDIGTRATPYLADLDNDGDLDLLVGSAAGGVAYFENTGTPNAAVFEARVDAANPFDSVPVGDGDSAPALVDVDDDGDLDLINGDLFGGFTQFTNQGNAEVPSFVLEPEGPLTEINLGLFSKVAFADIDRDGDLDAITGEEYGRVTLYDNIQSSDDPVFVPVNTPASPLFGIDVGYDSAFAFADMDGDGDLDGVFGNRFGNVFLLENRGTPTQPFFEIPENGRLLTGGTRYFTAPAMADLDEDGSPELVVGDDSGRLRYFENASAPGALQYVEQLGDDNPFANLLFTQNTTLTFGDLDGDGDFDAATGSFEGNLVYLENTTTIAGSPTFEIRLGEQNPFDGFSVGTNSAPALSDVDEDGDLDLIIGGEALSLLFYAENVGDAQSPSFAERVGDDNPFSLNPVGRGAAPTAIDLTGTGDTDFFVGRGAPGVVLLIQDLIFEDGFEDPEPQLEL